MRLEYVLAGLLAMGCTTSPFSETKPSVVQPIQFDKPRPSANIRSYETLTLTPEQNISITVTDVAERRSIRDIHMYFLPEGKQGIALHIAGSPLELEKKRNIPLLLVCRRAIQPTSRRKRQIHP